MEIVSSSMSTALPLWSRFPAFFLVQSHGPVDGFSGLDSFKSFLTRKFNSREYKYDYSCSGIG